MQNRKLERNDDGFARTGEPSLVVFLFVAAPAPASHSHQGHKLHT
jgi:hypothetical protein